MNKPKHIRLDFETASALDIFETGAWEYSSHPSTSVLCFSYAIEDQEPIGVITAGEYNAAAFNALEQIAKDPNCIVHAYNAEFERYIWKNILTKRYGITEIPTNRWRCTQARILAMSVPKGLNKSANFLNANEKKSGEGAAVMKKLCTQWENPKSISTIDMQNLLSYCIQDVKSERSLDEKTRELSVREQKVWELDQVINERGVKIDKNLLGKMTAIADAFSASVNDRLSKITNGEINKASEIQKIKKYLYDNFGIQHDSLDKNTIVEIIKDPNVSAEAKQILSLRAAGGKTSNAKLGPMASHTMSSDYARGCLIYHGATTGRWTSSGIQLHNLPARGDIKDISTAYTQAFNLTPEEFIAEYGDKTAQAISQMIRGLIVPPNGKRLIVSDFSNIEARLVVCLAGSEKGIQRFRDYDNKLSEDPYIMMAREVYNDNSITKEKNPKEREVGKAGVLGCGFGMGADKMQASCNSRGLEMDNALAMKVVSTYRNSLPEVPNLWKGLEKAMMTTIRTQSSASYNGITYTWESPEWVSCTLLSGRKLWYREPKIEAIKGAYGIKESTTYLSYDITGFKRIQSWGGVLTENVIQAMARDIMVQSMFNLEASGKFKVVLTVHDEIITYAEPNATPEEMTKLMKQKPIWAASFPIEAETKELTRYGK